MKFEAQDGKPRFVAGALGPTNRTLVDVARRERSGVSRGFVERNGRGL